MTTLGVENISDKLIRFRVVLRKQHFIRGYFHEWVVGGGGPFSTSDPCKMRAYATLVGLRYPPFFTPRELFLYVLPAFVSFFSAAFCLFFRLCAVGRSERWALEYFVFIFVESFFKLEM